MKTNRTAVTMAALTAIVLIGGIAWAASPVPDATLVETTSETVVSAGEAGDVVLSADSELEVIAVIPSDGWLAEVEVASGREVEVDFRSSDRRIQLNAELEDGEVRVRVRERLADTPMATSSTMPAGPDTTASTSTTVGTTSGPVEGEQVVLPAGAAGEVVLVVGSRIEIVDVRARPGWAAEVEMAVGREVEADFRSGDRRIQFDAELEDGRIRVRVRDRIGDSEAEVETYLSLDGAVSSASTGSTVRTSTTNTTETAGNETYSVPGVATVGITWENGRLTLASYVVAPGWTVEIEERSETRLRLDFESGDRDARFEARLDDGFVSVDIDGD